MMHMYDQLAQEDSIFIFFSVCYGVILNYIHSIKESHRSIRLNLKFVD